MIRLFYTCITRLFPDNAALKATSYSDLISKGALSLLMFAQRLKLLWIYFIQFQYWDQTKAFWQDLSYLSPDSLAGITNEIGNFILFSLCLIFFTLSLLIIHCLIVLVGKKSSQLILVPLNYSLKLANSLFFIPTTLALVMFFKYTDVTSEKILEYSGSIMEEYLYLGLYGKILAAFALLSHFFMTILTEGFNFSINFHSASSNLGTKSGVNMEVLMKIWLFAICCAYPYITPEKYLVYLFVQLLHSGFCVYYYVTRVPYYSAFIIFLKISENLEIFTISLFFTLGYLMNNASITLILSIILQPIILLAAKFSLNPEFHQNSNTGQVNYSMFIAENKKIILSAEDEKKIVRSFFQAYYECKNKLLLIHLAYYYDEVIKNFSLAAVKANLVSFRGMNIFNNFQVFKCQEKMNQRVWSECLGLKVIKFVESYEKALVADKNYCLQLLKMTETVFDQKMGCGDIEKELLACWKYSEQANKQYRILMDSNQESLIAYSLYGSYLIDLQGKNEDGQLYLAKSQSDSLKNSAKFNPKAVLYDSSKSFLIISANFSNLGKILHVSQSVCTILVTPQDELINQSIFNYLPKLKNIDFFSLLSRYLSTGTNHIIQPTSSVFIKNSLGFLVECKVYIEFIAIDYKIKILCILDPIKSTNKRQAAVLDNNGIIINSTKDLNLILEIPDYKLDLLNIRTILKPGVFEELLNSGSIMVSCVLYNEVIYLLRTEKIAQQSFYVFYALLDKHEIGKIVVEDEASQILGHLKEKKRVTKVQMELKSRSVPLKNPIKGRNSKIDEEIKLEIEKDTNYVTHSTSSTNANMLAQKIIRKTRRLFRLFIFLIVFLAAIMLVVSVMSLVIADKNIRTISNLSSIKVYGDISSELSKLALYIRSIDHSNYYKTELFFPIENINLTVQKLQSLKLSLKSKKQSLSFCENFEMCSDNSLAEKKNNSLYENINLFNYLTNTQNQAMQIYEDLKNGRSISSLNLCYIIYNSFDTLSNALKKTLETSQNCEIYRNNQLKYFLMYLLVASMFLYIIIYALMVVLSMSLHKKESDIWQNFFNIVYTSEGSVKSRVIARLTQTHNYQISEDLEKNIKKRQKFSHNFFLRFTAATFPLILISIGLCLLFFYGFYSEIEKLLIFRIQFLNIMMNRRICFINMAYYTMESVAEDDAIQNKCSNISWDSNPLNELTRINAELKILRQVFDDKNLVKMLPGESFDLLFDKFESDQNFLKLGTSPAFFYFRSESLFHAYYEKSEFKGMGKYFSEIASMTDTFGVIYSIVDSSSMNLINYQFQRILIYLIITLLFCFIVVIFAYFPYFNRKSKTLKCIGSLVAYLYATSNDNSSTS